MTGLLVKDFRLLTQRKSTALLYVCVAIFLSISMDTAFLISYFSIVGCLMAISTISYDEFDNGMPFILTLPVTRKIYAIEKYLFSFLWLTGFWFAACIIQFIMLTVRNAEYDVFSIIGQDAMTLFFLSFIILIMIPIDLKFGADKGRIVMLILFGIAIGITFLGGKILTFLSDKFGFDAAGILAKIGNMPTYVLVAIMVCAFLCLTLLSMFITAGVMKKKEY